MEDNIIQTTATQGKFMQYKANLNTNTTDISPYVLNYSISFGQRLANLCAYLSGNWKIPCSYNCNLSATNLNGLNFSFYGAGKIYGISNISNYKYGEIVNGCQGFW